MQTRQQQHQHAQACKRSLHGEKGLHASNSNSIGCNSCAHAQHGCSSILLPVCIHAAAAAAVHAAAADDFALHARALTVCCAVCSCLQIILSVAEHHSNLVPWQLVAQKTGAVLKHVRLTDSQELDMQVGWQLVAA
jgi:hypothetical protein